MRVNYPGISKDNELTRGIIKILETVLVEKFSSNILFKVLNFSAEGPVLTMIVDKDAENVKLSTIEIENVHYLGRTVDIDVYNVEGISISRHELGFEPRKCYLCNEVAHNCVRTRKHNVEEIKVFIQRCYDEYCEHSL